MKQIAPAADPELMLGFDTSDDAAVYRIDDNTAAVLTLDFFTPVVDDPYEFGCVAAANALSDVFAMGGKPLTALNILAFPVSLGTQVVAEVMRGGSDKVREAGAFVVGGHSIDDDEPKYGLSVFGTVHPDHIVLNSQDLDHATSAEEVVQCEYDGVEPLEMGFKNVDIIEVLNNLDTETVCVKLSDPTRAGIFLPSQQADGEDLLILQMPMAI